MPKVLVALPAGLLEQIDEVALSEHRNRSDLIREALRRYIENFKRNQQASMHTNAASINHNNSSRIEEKSVKVVS